MDRPTLVDRETKAEIFSAVRTADSGSPVVPVQLQPTDTFRFSCHRGVACWNCCCHGADITLTPMDILRLSHYLEIRPREFLTQYTLPAMWETADMPVAKLRMDGADGRGACAFMTEEGCSIYAARPATCRYYPLGLASVKMKGAEAKEDFHFLVRESHCRGHDDSREQSVADFRVEQGIEGHDVVDRGWMDVLMKLVSWKGLGGPYGKEMAPPTKKMFFMVSTDVDALRNFVFTTKFLDTYEIAPEAIEQLKTDDVAMLILGFDWMKNVMFNEKTLVMKEPVLRDSIVRAREQMGVS